ncbi:MULTISPECIES: hypothetical protein [unclassified Mycobacterium]|uniref:hypothetical protein n=1 Tax=unclassified Mycobacterium TaxID=2642494 RepID=UPI0029C6D45B|nr:MULTISPECIES: hypothetical protein [unclassified Mycobacterium]
MLRRLRSVAGAAVAAGVLVGMFATGTASAQSACAALGGTEGPGQLDVADPVTAASAAPS